MVVKHKIDRKGEPTTVYPGEYNALPADTFALRRALRSKAMTIIEPQASMRELPDHYRIELVVPGLNREDFFITTGRRMLHMTAVARPHSVNGPALSEGEGTLLSCFRCTIHLPANVDPDFAEAGYQNGILHICLFKTACPGKVGAGQIVVY